MTNHHWTATDVSWSCLKSQNDFATVQTVHTVTAVSPLVQDAVHDYIDDWHVALKEVVSMDSLTLANNSASQKARYVHNPHSLYAQFTTPAQFISTPATLAPVSSLSQPAG